MKIANQVLRNRSAANYKIIVLLIASLTLATSAQATSAGASQPNPTNNQHPVALDPNASLATCLKCHRSSERPAYAHRYVDGLHDVSHGAKQENGVTRVRFTAPVDHMCVSCHALSTADKVLHGPYREGLCMAFHSPRGSDFPAHMWASPRDTCMGCHTGSRLKVDDAKPTVTTPWGKL